VLSARPHRGPQYKEELTLQIATERSYALLVALTLFSASAGADGAQLQTKLSNQVARVTQPPIKAERQTWRRRMAQTPRPKKGCFVSTYPQTTWQEVRCVAPPQRPLLPRKGKGVQPATVGEGVDYSSQTTANTLTAEGSFDSVSGVTSEIGGGAANAYSLQLNTNFFATTTCSGAQIGCQGWEQYDLINGGTLGQATAFIQYWLINYGSLCPNGWISFNAVDCWRNSHFGVGLPTQSIATLEEQALTGVAASGSADDSLALSIGSQLYSVTGDNVFPDLGQHWNATEFNVFGPGNASEAVFNTGSTIVVRTAVDSGTTAAPSCAREGFTAETNNLTLVGTPVPESEAQWPSIVFTESNAGNPSTASCSATGVAPVSATLSTIVSGQSTTLTVTPSGSGPFTYQWYVSASSNNGMPISGATGASLTVNPAATTSYWVQISGPGGLLEYGQTTTITVEPSAASSSDAPLPLWAVCALGFTLFLLSRRALASQGLRTR
jgi:Ig-like domain CHU_C associated